MLDVTFAILDAQKTWKSDLTLRYTKHVSRFFFGEDFLNRIVFAGDVDEALLKCETEYLLIQSAGNILFDTDAVIKVIDRLNSTGHLFAGHILLQEDYAVIDKQFVVINIETWKKLDRPSFDNSKNKGGPQFAVTERSDNEMRPKQIAAISGTDRQFVPRAACTNGSEFVIRQLDEFGKCDSLNKLLLPNESHYLDSTSALSEIVSETLFEKKFLPVMKDRVFSSDYDASKNVHFEKVDIVCVPAVGLKALNLIKHYHAKRAIIYSSNEDSLELQRRIFNITSPSTYGEIVQEFLTDFPGANIVDDWRNDKNYAITPTSIPVEYRLVDMFSYEAIDLLNRIDHEKSLLADFSNIYVTPHNYYRRPAYQVTALFAEIYSILKSRTGATFILGQTPDYIELVDIEINTSTAKYSIDPTVDPTAPDEDGIPKPKPEPIVFRPDVAVPIKEKLEERVYTPQENRPKIQITSDPISIAKDLGYTESKTVQTLGGNELEVILLSKVETLDATNFTFEYYVHVETEQWSFKTGIEGYDKRIEFSNGISLDRLKKHLLNDFKINPSKTKKFFDL